MCLREWKLRGHVLLEVGEHRFGLAVPHTTHYSTCSYPPPGSLCPSSVLLVWVSWAHSPAAGAVLTLRLCSHSLSLQVAVHLPFAIQMSYNSVHNKWSKANLMVTSAVRWAFIVCTKQNCPKVGGGSAVFLGECIM